MNLSTALIEAIVTAVGAPIVAVNPVGGGDISSAARVDLADGRQAFVKWRSDGLAGLFTAERYGLELLRSAKALRVPEVLAQGEATHDGPAFILMTWLGRGSESPGVAEALGRGLAALHRVTHDAYGLDHDNFIGANPQPNQPAVDWVTFFRE
ncbi:MAG TPA: fructosamine kinase family protein, partial [Anaerolineae bacterium]